MKSVTHTQGVCLGRFALTNTTCAYMYMYQLTIVYLIVLVVLIAYF